MKNYSNEIADLNLEITEVRKERKLLQISTDLKVKQVFDTNFNPFQEVEITVRGGSAIFHSKDEDGLRREIFSIYFNERYIGTDELRLSYY